MKAHRALLAAAVLALAASPALAQNPPPEGGRRMQGVLKGITLTGDQQAKIDSIRASSRAQMPAFTPGARPDSATREKMRELFRRQMEEIRGVLTPDQQKIFDRNLAEMRGRRPGGP